MRLLNGGEAITALILFSDVGLADELESRLGLGKGGLDGGEGHEKGLDCEGREGKESGNLYF